MSNKEKVSLVPKLRFPEFRGTKGWGKARLIDTADRSVKWSFIGGPFGSNLKSSDYVEDGVRIIQLQNIGDGKFFDDYRIFTTVEKADELRSNNIYPGEIIMSKMGDPVGRACLIPNHHERYVMCSDGIRLVVDEKAHDKYFVYSLINSPLFRSTVEKTATGSTRKRIGLDELKNLPMRLPAKAEQQKIADCLSSLDELIAAQARKVDALKIHKKGLMQQLFPREGETQPRLRFPEFRDVGNWIPTALGAIASFSSGGTPLKDNSEYWGGNIPWVSASSMYELHVSQADHYVTPLAIGNGTRIAKKGALLILVRGSMLFKRVPMCVATVDVAFNQDVKALQVDPSVNSIFLIYQLMANEYRIPINETGIGAGKIELADLKEFGLFIPASTTEQQRIADCLIAFETLITSAIQELETLKTHKNGLMQQLFPSAEALEA